MKTNPTLVPGVAAYPLFRRVGGEDTWILGHAELDRYLTVPASILPCLHRAAALLDGTRSTCEVRNLLRDELSQDLDVDSFVARLGSAGLLLGPDGTATERPAPARLLTLELGSIRLGRVSAVANARAAWLPHAWSMLLCLLAMWSLILIVAGPHRLPHGVLTRDLAPLFGIAAFLSMLAHELSHGVAALRRGLVPESITAALYLGFIPMLYLRIPGLYTLSPVDRIRIWAAGTGANLVIASAALASARLVPESGGWSGLLVMIAFWNIAVAKFNLLPFLPTDGYFILATLLREPNLRAQAHQVVKGWVRGRFGSTRWWVTAYAVCTLLLTLRLGIYAGRWLVFQAGAGGIAAIILYFLPFGLWAALVGLRRAATSPPRRRNQNRYRHGRDAVC